MSSCQSCASPCSQHVAIPTRLRHRRMRRASMRQIVFFFLNFARSLASSFGLSFIYVRSPHCILRHAANQLAYVRLRRLFSTVLNDQRRLVAVLLRSRLESGTRSWNIQNRARRSPRPVIRAPFPPSRWIFRLGVDCDARHNSGLEVASWVAAAAAAAAAATVAANGPLP